MKKPNSIATAGRDGFLNTVLESLTHPFYVIDARTYSITMANSAARLGAVAGTTTCHALTHRNDTPCGTEAHPCPLELVKQTRKPVTVEHIHYDQDGSARNVEVHGFPIFDGDGNVIQMIEYCIDVTDRKQAEAGLRQSEQRYRSFVQDFQGIVYQGRMNFVPIFFHGAVEELTGYREDEFIAGKPRWDEVIHADDFGVIAQAEAGLRTVPGYSTEREYRIRRKDQEIRWVHELIQNVCDDSGTPSFVQGVIYDITERKQMEEDLRRHREHLEELVQARTKELTQANQQLLEEIARRKGLEEELLNIVERERQRIGRELHDSIGQQLTGIAFMMEVLGERLSGASPAQDTAYAEKIEQSVVRAIEQTRILARGLNPIAPEEGGLAVALRELASSTQELFGISCTFRCESEATPVRASVVVNLYRIAQEAITNAVRHGKAKNIRIELGRKNGRLRLRVVNDGLGLPGQRVRNEGMGLRIMQHRAEIIGGSLNIRGRARGGAVVTCTVDEARPTR